MTSQMIITSQVCALYKRYAVVLHEEYTYGGIKITLGIDRAHKEMTTAKGVKLRGPHLAKSVKESWQNAGMNVLNVNYEYIDGLPDAEEYFTQTMGIDRITYVNFILPALATCGEFK